MIVASALTIDHYFAANFPTSIWQGSFCDLSAFFNCDASSFSRISQLAGVPLGYFGIMVGGLVALGVVFPSAALGRTNRTLALFNVVGVVVLFLYSVVGLKSLCLLCSGYYVFAVLGLIAVWKDGSGAAGSFFGRWLRPSPLHLATFGVVTLTGAFGFAEYHQARVEAQVGGVTARVVEQYFSLPQVSAPSVISPYMSVQSTERFEDATIRIIEYGDFLCPDCRYLHEQIQELEEEFRGQINVVFQFFPLDARCNPVVAKDKHPGACELSYMAAYDPAKFRAIHDEVFANLEAAKSPAWRRDLARRYGVEAALSDSATQALVQRIIGTGAEYEKTSEEYAHGIRSTPTIILNNRMVIGTFPHEQLRAIFQALVEERELGERKFMEHWVEE